VKIETEIPDIKREEIIEAMARQLLTEWHEESDPEMGPVSYPRATKLGEAMERYLDDKIDTLATKLVNEAFDAAIRTRIGEAVEETIREGWIKTDEYGAPRGKRVTLKDRVGEILNERDRYHSPSDTHLDARVKKAVDEVMTGAFKKEVDGAVAKLRAQLDAAVTGKFTDAIKKAMGLS
jgi:hypothetical protein